MSATDVSAELVEEQKAIEAEILAVCRQLAGQGKPAMLVTDALLTIAAAELLKMRDPSWIAGRFALLSRHFAEAADARHGATTH